MTSVDAAALDAGVLAEEAVTPALGVAAAAADGLATVVGALVGLAAAVVGATVATTVAGAAEDAPVVIEAEPLHAATKSVAAATAVVRTR